ncbi:MAG: glycoside hydrolase family 3 C-terminal domain-containing protein, partial [Prevotella sp.]|nr:glycoside hydrolase family 3 C-terminal domain-containing protein [Prevotella sp.]
LKNNGILPLRVNDFKTHPSKLMVMGPNAADSTMLWGIYFGKPSHTVTPLEGIQSKVGDIPYLTACSITNMTVKDMIVGKATEAADGSTTLLMEMKGEKTYTIEEIVKQAQAAETIVFVGGISPNLEREQASVKIPGFDGGDRTSIELPQVQRDILKALHEAGKKIIFVNCSGSAVALVPEQEETCDAIIQAWYAGEQGGHALADVIFGDYNPSGKLAVTFYKDDSQLPPFEEYKMEGRTYRYFHGTPLYPFGYGLSYTTYQYGKPQYRDNQITVNVKNTGKIDGTEIVQVYMRRPSDKFGPVKTLRGYARVDLKAGEQQTVTIDFPKERFENWDENTNTMRIVPGEYELFVGSSSMEKDLQKLKVQIR